MRGMIERELTRRIAVVEDDPDARALTEQLLTLSGFAVRAFHSAEHALAEIVADPPDAVVTDVMLPGMGGRAFAATLRERAPRVRVIAVTGDDEAAAGGEFDAVIIKPMDTDEFVDTVRRLAEPRARVLRRRRLDAVA
jgi:two-component system C4-dicarboxylate transport response regulator DctD